MGGVALTEGVKAVPQDVNTGRLWGRIRRQQYGNYEFPAATTTPFSANTPAGVLAWDAKLAYSPNPTPTPAGELDLEGELSGIQLVIANNASGQVLSGITLSDYDKLPTSGLVVPGQGYTTATNVATGASVTLAALNLASGSAVRLFIPINNGSLRQLIVNPTYAAAVTIGTGSLEIMTIPTVDQMSIKGSNALYDGQVTVTTTAAALSSLACSEVSIQADPGNTAAILVGSATGQHTNLAAGQSMDLSVNNLATIYAVAVSGSQKLNYLARS